MSIAVCCNVKITYIDGFCRHKADGIQLIASVWESPEFVCESHREWTSSQTSLRRPSGGPITPPAGTSAFASPMPSASCRMSRPSTTSTKRSSISPPDFEARPLRVQADRSKAREHQRGLLRRVEAHFQTASPRNVVSASATARPPTTARADRLPTAAGRPSHILRATFSRLPETSDA